MWSTGLVGFFRKVGASMYFSGNFGIYLQKMCLFSERGDLIFARHGTVLASKAKRDAPTEAVGVCCLCDEKAKSDRRSWIMGMGHASF